MAEKKSAKKPAAKKSAVKKPPPEPVVVARVAVYRDELWEWRWKALARNNKIVADSAEGYNNKMYAIKVARSLYPAVPVEIHS